MKSLQPKNNSMSTRTHSPFFQKGNRNNFFEKSNKPKPFFNSNPIQSKLNIGQPDDIYEKEADTMADKVVQRLSDNNSVQTKALSNSITPIIQTKCSACEKEKELQKKEIKDEKDLLTDKLQKKPVFEANPEKPGDGNNIENGRGKQVQAKLANSADAPASIIQSLGKGNSMNAGTRGKMESAFGTNFSKVEVHTDSSAASLSRNMNARAFTVDNHIAFGSGEYNPGTLAGDALMAHELAHVIQQGNGKTSKVQSKGGTEYGALEKDADESAAGAVMSYYGGTKKAFGNIGKKIMPRMKSGLRLQKCATVPKKVVTPEKVVTQEEIDHNRFRSKVLSQRDANLKLSGTLLAQISAWASSEQTKQGAKNIIGVEGLDAKQLENAKQAVGILRSLSSQFNTSGLEDVRSKLREVSKIAKEAKRYTGSTEPEIKGQLTLKLNATGDALNESIAALEKLRDSVDGYPIYLEIKNAEQTLEAVKQGKIDPYEGIETFLEQIKSIHPKIFELQTKYNNYPASIDRIAFVVQNFIAVNSPSFAGAPSIDEIKKFKGSLSGSLAMDFQAIYGMGTMDSSFELFVLYANQLEDQLSIRIKMAEAGIVGSMVPTQGQIDQYFKTLVKKPDSEVFNAYQEYTNGYFYHRIVTTIEDMNVSGVSEIFARKLSITGSRPLVCSGYAILGDHLITTAGGKLITYINAVRATDDDILNNKIDTGHTVAKMKRKSKQFFVSNNLIVDSEENAIGPNAVAWEKSDAPLIQATGPNQAASLEALKKVIIKKRDMLEGKRK